MHLQKISFKADSTNLLQKHLKTSVENQKPAETTPQVTQVIQPKENKTDTFQSKEGKTSFIKQHGGIMALAVSAIGIPATYVVTKRAGAKNINKLQSSITELTEKLNKLNIDEKVQKAVAEATGSSNKVQKMVSGKSNLLTILLGLGTGVGISEFVKNNRAALKEHGYKDDEITDAERTATNIIENPQIALRKATEAHEMAQGVDGKAQNAVNIAQGARDTANSMDSRINEARNRADEALGAVHSGIKPETQKFVKKYYDLWLMQYPGWEKKINLSRSEATMEVINNAAVKRLDRSAEKTLADIKAYKEKYAGKLTSLWSLTSEFKPIKLGGLGDVPVDLQDNFTKLGIDQPTFIPMYETPGVSRFIVDNSNGNNSAVFVYDDKKEYQLSKIADTQIEVFKNGTTTFEPVEFYQSEENGKKLIFVRNNAFKGALYDSTTQADEPEKFAIFNKAVYTLAKAKVADALGEKLSISAPINKYPAYYELQAPNSMILNDWHAAPMAGLMRYRTAMEYNYAEVNQGVFEAMTDMPLLMIGHNLGVQGASNSANKSIPANNNVTQNIINTLYDKFAAGITENAHSGLDNEDLCNTVLLKRTTADKQFNSLFHGIALADWFVPVSKNYANEIVDDVMKSHITNPLLKRRKATGTLEGIINGTDLIKHNMNAVSTRNFVEDLILEKYDKNTPISEIMERRTENKRRFFNQFMKPILDGTNDKPELVSPEVGRRDISEQEFVDAPLISFAHRLTDQKGLRLLKGAIFKLFDNWDAEGFGNQPKPFFLIGGPPENEKEVGYLYDLKNPNYGTNKERLDHVFAMKGNMPNPAIMSASTFFCAPSTFEPCGLTQGECFAKGTPIIATDTGGYHDTIIDGKTGFLAPHISEDSVYETLVKALKMYYFDNDSYQQMIKNDLNIDFSWARAGKEGPIYEYTDKLGFNKEELPDIALC